MLLFLVTCVSLAFLHLSLWCSSSLSSSPITPRNRGKEKLEEEQSSMLLDLPELALECILERLPPAGLRSMAGVCTSLRERCLSDRLWETHFNLKWGSLMGPAARVHWLSHNHHRNHSSGNHRWLIHLLSHLLPPPLRRISSSDYNSSSPIMSWYLALETGSFSFPAQVFNRENGHAGFLLSCYDAELTYDSPTHTFHARYPPHGKRAIAVESGVPWERLRAPPVHTSAHDLHISDCLNDLRPGDHIEIQWRRNKDFPYGWWYGVVGHLESCDGSESYCRCPNCDVVVLEFNQYSQGSRWRRTTINRKEHREEGNQADGFYGGIRKLRSSDEDLKAQRGSESAILGRIRRTEGDLEIRRRTDRDLKLRSVENAENHEGDQTAILRETDSRRLRSVENAKNHEGICGRSAI